MFDDGTTDEEIVQAANDYELVKLMIRSNSISCMWPVNLEMIDATYPVIVPLNGCEK